MEEKIKEIYSLIEQWTRAEIISRLGQFGSSSIDFAMIKIQKENEIRKLLFGTDDLVALGIEWKILKDRDAQQIEDNEQTKKDLKQQYLQLQKELAEMETAIQEEI